jgi:4-hydroxy-4-methyl-2-oxoglutarate aldolase
MLPWARTAAYDYRVNNRALVEKFNQLSTPLITDAALRLKIPVSIAPPGIHPVAPGMRLAGRVLPAKHFGSVDVFLEAMESSEPGDILVIDNGGRNDEGCIGDLTALETQAARLAGIVVWGNTSRHSRTETDQPPDLQLWQLPLRPAAARPSR